MTADPGPTTLRVAPDCELTEAGRPTEGSHGPPGIGRSVSPSAADVIGDIRFACFANHLLVIVLAIDGTVPWRRFVHRLPTRGFGSEGLTSVRGPVMSDCAYAGPVDAVVKTTVWLTKPSHGTRIAEVTAAPFVKRCARDRRLWSAGSRSRPHR